MKSSRKSSRAQRSALLVSSIVFAAASILWSATEWKTVVSGSAIEAALYRLMPLPSEKTVILGPRPPREAVPLLSELLQKQPTAELYSLRATNEEAALDFSAAEADWKRYAEAAQDQLSGRVALADFYHRRLRPQDEINALEIVAKSPASGADKLKPTIQQRSWSVFERSLTVIRESALPSSTSDRVYQNWMARYPAEPGVYARYFEFLLDQKQFAQVEKLVGQYQATFPQDGVFPVKAHALLAYKRGSVQQGLAVYEEHFQPLWPHELVQSYFDLLTETGSLRAYLDHAKASLEGNPDDLKATARIFYYYQRQGRADAAQQALDDYRRRKEQRNGKWTGDELYTLARLSQDVRSYPEAARYYYALYSNSNEAQSQERALAGLSSILLEAPERGIRLGAGELSMYKDIAAMDPGPGFLNGTLSLILNSTTPAGQYSEEEQRAVPYFHRAEAAELIRLLDSRFPNSERRAQLHALLLDAYSSYGESEAVIRDGRQFLALFPGTPEREQVALLMANAYERTKRSEEEFALYDSLLAGMAKASDNVPLGMQTTEPTPYLPLTQVSEARVEDDVSDSAVGAQPSQVPKQSRRAFQVAGNGPRQADAGVRSPEYSRVLERYLARLVSTEQLPRALAVLRKEIDRNPNDPGLYERLAQFLEQNRLGAQQERVYERAIQQFQDSSWYHKLARFYIRERRNADFNRLTRQVVEIFSGMELDSYFQQEVSRGARPNFFLDLNRYANARFPHDLVFVRNILGSYHLWTPPWVEMIQQHWWEAEDLRNRYFQYLARTGKLNDELASLHQSEENARGNQWEKVAAENPLATRFIGEAEMWRSHFEESTAPMGALAREFPADTDIGTRAGSLYRSLTALTPKDTEAAIAIEENLYNANPQNRNQLAHIGDVFADRELFDRAAPYWERMKQVRPGEPQAYLDPATVYWDYYDFSDALRLLNEGRAKLNDAALYRYEEGAIYENQRDYAKAVAEYVQGALRVGDARCRGRLIELARRPKLLDAVEGATASLADGDSPSLDSVKLRIDLLDTQNRTKDIEQLMSALASRTSSLELLAWLEETAAQRSLVDVQQRVLEHEAAVTTDPVRRLELRYSLVHFYEQRKDLAEAQRSVDALYRENPKIMGVVRSTVDFYWRNKERQRAIEVLWQAANDSYPALRKQFQLEAARKETDLGQYEQARKLLGDLLKDSPYNHEYLAAIADTYARAGDDQGLKAFYLSEIESFRKAPLNQDSRNQEIAALRRGTIPALTHLKDHSGAVDQYIEIINQYPEDEALVSEAALYAQKHGFQQKLVACYGNTIRQSPRDYRWPTVLARIQAQLENFPEAIEAYALATRIRPDRTDLRAARADMLERLMRFDDAAAEYQQLFQLNYHDTQWMERLAVIRARQERIPETVAALDTALVANRAEKAENYFEVARRLESWGMLPQAREYAQKGVDVAGRDLLAMPEHHSGARLYVRILTRLRQQDAAYDRLRRGLSDADSLASTFKIAAEKVEKSGIVSVTDQEWRNAAITGRKANARSGFADAMQEIGSTVATYFTPEEKVAFAGSLHQSAAGRNDDDLASFFVPAARAADLPDLESRWLAHLVLSHYSLEHGQRLEARLIDLEQQRMRFDKLGSTLEKYAGTISFQEGRDSVLLQAGHVYCSGGDYDKELAVLSQMEHLGGSDLERLFSLLMERHPEKLLQYIRSSAESLSDAAAQYVIDHGDETLAMQAIAARAHSLPPVWTRSYDALAGLYFGDRTASVQLAFLSALGEATIGERLARPVDRSQQLAGNIWFYYGTQYGIWMGNSKAGDPEEFLPAVLEQSPGGASAYVTTAEYYTESGNPDRAIEDYRHTLELAPGRADIHDRIAVLYWRQQRRADAIAEWKKSLEMLDAQVQMRAVPPEFWTTLKNVLGHLGSRKLLSDLHSQVDTVLRDYVRKNGSYSADQILRAAFEAGGDAKTGAAWMLDLASVSPDPNSLLMILARTRWIPAPAKEPIYQQIVTRLEDRLRAADGLAKEYAEQELRRWKLIYVRYLIDQKQFDRADDLLQSLANQEPSSGNELELRLRIAVARSQLDSTLEHYRAVPDKGPGLQALRKAALALQRAGMRSAARKIFEYVYSQEIAAHNLTPGNMLGLAEIRLQDGDTASALELLRRLTLVVGQPFENLDWAASLLARSGHHAEAAGFLAQLMKAKPWETNIRLRLAQEQIAAADSVQAARQAAVSVAADSQAIYPDRVQAAQIASGDAPSLGSDELDWLTHEKTNPLAAADKQYFYPARLKAAERATREMQVSLLRNAVDQSQDRDTARVPLFFALAARGQDRLAISALDPQLKAGLLNAPAPDQSLEPVSNDEIPATDLNETQDEDESAQQKLPVKLSAERRAKIAATLAGSYGKLEQFDSALRYYRLAVRLETSKALKIQLAKQRDDVNAILRRRASNKLRAPDIHKELDQHKLVAPRVTAARAPLQGATTKGGGL